MRIEHDKISGQDTTGHEWDGLKELNTPVPRVVTWAYRLTILFSVGYWIFFPAWPYITDFTRGLTGYSSRTTVIDKVEIADQELANFDASLLANSIDQLADVPAIRAKYEASTSILFADNCAACHGQNLKGQTGFPNLVDNAWLWSGTPEEIEITLQYGINSGHDEERYAEMSAFGRDGILEQQQINELVAYVQFISGQEHDTTLASNGTELFEGNCSGCHGENGEGGLEIGAPTLTDNIWIYGGDGNTLYDTIWNGRQGVMPSWEGRLTPAEIRKLALYVYWQNHDRGK